MAGKRAAWIFSQAGLESLMQAGVSIHWLKAWLQSAGASDVSVHFLESDTWQQHNTIEQDHSDWQLFFATPKELQCIADDNFSEYAETIFQLENPPRPAKLLTHSQQRILLLPIGEIAFQRQHWLALLNDGEAFAPLYVCAHDRLPIRLGSGLSASLDDPEHMQCLNSNGLLIEEQVIQTLKQRKLFMRTVESCTAGGIAARLCRVPGSSAVLDRAWVTYSNQAKQEEVAVDAELIKEFGAVSQAVVIAMADGGVDAKHVCVATSGIAGPGGGTEEKPVGTVWIAVAIDGQGIVSRCLHLTGARHDIQTQAVIAALAFMLTTLPTS